MWWPDLRYIILSLSFSTVHYICTVIWSRHFLAFVPLDFVGWFFWIRVFVCLLAKMISVYNFLWMIRINIEILTTSTKSQIITFWKPARIFSSVSFLVSVLRFLGWNFFWYISAYYNAIVYLPQSESCLLKPSSHSSIKDDKCQFWIGPYRIPCISILKSLATNCLYILLTNIFSSLAIMSNARESLKL